VSAAHRRRPHLKAPVRLPGTSQSDELNSHVQYTCSSIEIKDSESIKVSVISSAASCELNLFAKTYYRVILCNIWAFISI
jgi:hypothetical protein